MSSELVRSYLLGTLEETSAASIEERYFTDRGFFLSVQAVETALIEDYLAGRLAPPIKSLFEARYLAVPELRRRLEEVRAAHVRAVAAFGPKRHLRLLLTAAILLVCIGAAAVWLIHERTRFETLPLTAENRPVQATLVLTPGLLKGESAGTAKLPHISGRGSVRLVLEIPGQRTAILCSVHLSSASSDGAWKGVWSASQPVWSTASKGGQKVDLILDSSLLIRGDYLVEILGTDQQVRDSYVFHVSEL